MFYEFMQDSWKYLFYDIGFYKIGISELEAQIG